MISRKLGTRLPDFLGIRPKLLLFRICLAWLRRSARHERNTTLGLTVEDLLSRLFEGDVLIVLLRN